MLLKIIAVSENAPGAHRETVQSLARQTKKGETLSV